MSAQKSVTLPKHLWSALDEMSREGAQSADTLMELAVEQFVALQGYGVPAVRGLNDEDDDDPSPELARTAARTALEPKADAPPPPPTPPDPVPPPPRAPVPNITGLGPTHVPRRKAEPLEAAPAVTDQGPALQVPPAPPPPPPPAPLPAPLPAPGARAATVLYGARWWWFRSVRVRVNGPLVLGTSAHQPVQSTRVRPRRRGLGARHWRRCRHDALFAGPVSGAWQYGGVRRSDSPAQGRGRVDPKPSRPRAGADYRARPRWALSERTAASGRYNRIPTRRVYRIGSGGGHRSRADDRIHDHRAGGCSPRDRSAASAFAEWSWP